MVLRVAFLDALEYRIELIIRIAGWGVRLVISLFLWFAVTQSKGEIIAGYTFEKIILYFFLIQIMATFVFNDSGFAIHRDIHYGDFSNYLVKPIRYLPFRFSVEFSYIISRSLMGLLIFGGALFLYQPSFFTSVFVEPTRWLLFLLALLFAMLLNFLLVAMISLLAFWIYSAHRLLFIYFGIINIFSGLILPLDFFPEKLLAVVKLLPFPYLFYYPLQIILKPEVTVEMFAKITLLPQLLQIAVFSALVSLLFIFGLKKYEAVGK